MKTLSLMLLLVLCAPAWAQPAPDANRERAQLRRAQAALQAAQAQVDGLTAEKAALAKEKSSLADELQRQRGAARGQQQQREQALAQAAQLRQDIAAASSRQQQAETQAAEREAQLQQQLAKLRSDGAELRQGNASVTVLLEGKTQALAAAQTKNGELHSLALQAVEMWRNKTPFEASLASGTLFGTSKVREEDAAEALRARIDAQRLQ